MRKLVLYSNQISPASAPIDARLFALVNKTHPRVGFIPSRGDPSRKYFIDRHSFYADHGADLCLNFELDTDYHPDLLAALWECDAIHLSGGNTFYFLHWLQERQLLAPLREYVAKGGVLIGVSAGAMLMTPNITSASYSDDIPLSDTRDDNALGLVDFAFVPHLDEVNPDLVPLKRLSREQSIVVYGSTDSGGIVVDGDRVECIGKVIRIDERSQ